MIDFFNEDCFERIRHLPDKSIKCIVTDPPYGIGFNGQTSKTDWDNLTDKQYYNFLCKFLNSVKRILTDDGTIWMCCARTKIPIVFRAIEDSDLNNNLENWLTYARQKGRESKNRLKSQAEEIIHITKPGYKYVFNHVEYLREVVAPYIKDGKPRGWFLDQLTGMRVRWSGIGNVLAFTSPFFKCKFEKQIHSTQKPVLLFVELMMISSNKGDKIFDPFAGSASSGVAAKICGRDWIGCEIDKEMFDKANNWLNNIDIEESKNYLKSRVNYEE